ncbi:MULTISPECIES: hypothetical protein [unclassified Pseudovibrio]|uniref:hypothetical protein n=1 Tax=unclassified Pseudovibrio TaxID=2627060 RepID=UPI0007AE4191|nr:MULTISPECIES: hypothetical protein [unclassified Pseudovibrio]
MRFALALFVLLFASSVQAETNPEPWQEDAIEKVLEYNRIDHAQWNSEHILQLFSSAAWIDWYLVIDQVICKQFLRDIKKPKDHSFVVIVFQTGTEKSLEVGRCH